MPFFYANFFLWSALIWPALIWSALLWPFLIDRTGVTRQLNTTLYATLNATVE